MSPSDFSLTIFTNTIFGIPDYTCWIIIAALIVMSGLFTSAENAFSGANKYLFKVKADEGSFTAKLIYRFIDKFDNTLVTILVSYNVIQTFCSFLCALLWLGICEDLGITNGLDAVFSTLTVSIMTFFISDMIPKVISRRFPNRMCYVLIYPICFFFIITYPVALIFRGLLKLVHKIFRIKEKNLLSKEDLLLQADEAVVEEDKSSNEDEKEELFEENELKILKRALSFDQINVKDVLTPKEKMFVINYDELSYAKINEIVSEVTYSRIPIYKNNKDNIVGILIIRDFFKEYISDPHFDIRSIIIDPIFVTSDMKIDDIFAYFNKEKTHIGIVKDGDSVLGLLTMEDVLEELVGDINENTESEEKGNE